MRQLKIHQQITAKESLSFDKYLHDIGKIDLISAEEEVELTKRIKKGDKQALGLLVKSNLRFVISVAKQYQNQGLSLPDLINEGNLGLIKAAERFDETKGFKFISYAVWWVRQSILHALAINSRMVRLPLNRIGHLNKMNKIYNRLEQEFQREPTITELAENTQSTDEMVEETFAFSTSHISMDAPLHGEEANNMYDVLLNEESTAPDSGLIKLSLREEIKRLLKVLSMKEAEIICYYFGLNGISAHSLEEIGTKFGLTREGVRQLKEKAIKKLRDKYPNHILRSYLG